MQLGYYAQDHRANINMLYTSVKVHCNKMCMTRQQRGIWAHRSKNTDPRTQIQKHGSENTDPRTQIQEHGSKNTDTCTGILHCEEVYGMKLVCIVVSGGKAECNKENLLWLRSCLHFKAVIQLAATAKADVKLPGYIVPSSEICNSYISPIPLCLNCNCHTFSWCGR